MAGQTTTICIAEDRQRDVVALKLLLLSIAQHVPNVRVVLSPPLVDAALEKWFSSFPFVDLRQDRAPGHRWNVKPYVLLDALAEGDAEVWWLDSDIIVTRDFRPLSRGVSASTLFLTEEPRFTPADGAGADGGHRARQWGLHPARLLPRVINTSVIRVTRSHVPLLSRWSELLEHPEYRSAPHEWVRRPAHLQSDQDVLTALLSSEEFADVPLHVLRSGPDIVQALPPVGPSPRERWSMLRHGPATFVHAQGWAKPWFAETSPGRRSLHARLERLHQETSAYTLAAHPYRSDIAPELGTGDWLSSRSRVGVASTTVGIGNPALTGLPLSLAYGLWRSGKTARARLVAASRRGD